MMQESWIRTSLRDFRAHARLRVDRDVRVRVDGSMNVAGRLVDLSLGGFKIALSRPLEVGECARLTIDTGGDSSELRVDSVCCWCDDLPRRGEFLMGWAMRPRRAVVIARLRRLMRDFAGRPERRKRGPGDLG